VLLQNRHTAIRVRWWFTHPTTNLIPKLFMYVRSDGIVSSQSGVAVCSSSESCCCCLLRSMKVLILAFCGQRIDGSFASWKGKPASESIYPQDPSIEMGPASTLTKSQIRSFPTGLDLLYTPSTTSPHRERPRPKAPHLKTSQHRRPIRTIVHVHHQIDQVARGHRGVVLILRRLRVMVRIEALHADRCACASASIAVREVVQLDEAHGIGAVDQDRVVDLRGGRSGVGGIDVGSEDVFDA